jgi:hypothetical protein
LIAPGPQRAIWGVCPPKKVVSPKVRAFLSFIEARFDKPPYWNHARRRRPHPLACHDLLLPLRRSRPYLVAHRDDLPRRALCNPFEEQAELSRLDNMTCHFPRTPGWNDRAGQSRKWRPNRRPFPIEVFEPVA